MGRLNENRDLYSNIMLTGKENGNETALGFNGSNQDSLASSLGRAGEEDKGNRDWSDFSHLQSVAVLLTGITLARFGWYS